nr:hypothetical protein [Tanacetum cinerariifolium]
MTHTQDNENPQSPTLYHPFKSSSVSFHSRLKKQKRDDNEERLLSIFRQIHFNLPFLEAMIHNPKGSKTFNIGKSMRSRYTCDDYLYCVDHTTKLVHEQWVDTVDHDGKWIEIKEEDNPQEIRVVSFYPKHEPSEPLKWKALEIS